MRTTLVTVALFLFVGGTAHATHGPTLQEAITATDAELAGYGKDPCPGAVPRFSSNMPAGVGGYAHGWTGQTWTAAGCDIELKAEMHPCSTYITYRHERIHMMFGPDHTGLIHPSVEDPWHPACEPHEVDEERGCMEDEPCWNWISMGNGKRAIFLKGRKRAIKVGPYAFAIHAKAGRINWKKTRRMRGDFTARYLWVSS